MIFNKSPPADVQVRIPGRVIRVPVRKTGIRAIIPVPTNDEDTQRETRAGEHPETLY